MQCECVYYIPIKIIYHVFIQTLVRYLHACLLTYLRTYRQTHRHTDTRTYICRYKHTCIHISIHHALHIFQEISEISGWEHIFLQPFSASTGHCQLRTLSLQLQSDTLKGRGTYCSCCAIVVSMFCIGDNRVNVLLTF